MILLSSFSPDQYTWVFIAFMDSIKDSDIISLVSSLADGHRCYSVSCLSFRNCSLSPYRWFCPCLWAASSHALTDLNSKEYQEWPSADLQCSFSVQFISFQYSVLKLYPLGLFRPSASSFHLREPTKLLLDSSLPVNYLETLLRQ